MWTPIFELAKTTSLLLTISADTSAKQLVVTVTPRPSGKPDPALSQPLTLRGTPEELDAEFVSAITQFSTAYASLKETVEAAVAVMAATKQSVATKAAAKPAAAPAKAATPAPKKPATVVAAAPAVTDRADDDGDDDEATASASTAEAPAPDDKTLNLFA